MNLDATNSDLLDDGLIESVSAAGSLESLLEVTIQDETLARDYSFVFFPRRGATKGSKTTRRHYYQVFTYLADVSAVVNAALAQIRYMYSNVPDMLAAGAKPDLVGERCLNIFKEMVSSSEDQDKSMSSSVTTLMQSISGGKAHIIKPSVRYKGGLDVMYSGVPGPAYGLSTAMSNSLYGGKNVLSINKRDQSELISSSKYAQQHCVEMAKAVLAWAHGLKQYNALPGEQRSLTQVPVRAYDLSALQKTLDELVVKSKVGSRFADLSRVSKNLNTMPENLAEGIGKYFNFLVIREPHAKTIEYKTKYPHVQESSGDYELNSTIVSVLQADVSFSLAMNLPEELVSFITQTPKGKQPSLTALNTWVNVWSSAVIKAPRLKGGKDRVTVGQCPRYVLPPSSMGLLSKKRKALGMFSEKGRCNEDGIYVSQTGRFNYCPESADEAVLDNARNYAQLQENALKLSFDAGSPLISSQVGSSSPYFDFVSPEYKKGIRQTKDQLGRYGGSMQAYSWDYNTILVSSKASPDRLRSLSLVGATRPDDLTLTDYLKKPFSEAFLLMHPKATDVTNNEELVADTLLDSFSKSSVFENIAITYAYLLFAKKVPTLNALITAALKALNYKTLDLNQVPESDDKMRLALTLEQDLYGSMKGYSAKVMDERALKTSSYYEMKALPDNFTYVSTDPANVAQFQAIKTMLTNQAKGVFAMLDAALKDSAASTNRSNLMRWSLKNNEMLEDSPYHFDMETSPLNKFGNVYNYLGGRVFLEMLNAIRAVDHKTLSVVDLNNPMPMPAYDTIVTDVMPFVTMFSKYVPDSNAIMERGEKQAEALQPDQSISVNDVHLPGSKSTFQVFPHQLEAFKSLLRRPRWATLDIAPGGGKTLLGLIEIGSLVHEGLIKRPCVICPNGLVRNWIEDMHLVTEGRWNVIPITSFTIKTWGEERLTKMIQTAPINTIFVVGITALRLERYQMVIGNHVEQVSAVLEFTKKFGFDYVILDESHKAKNMQRQTHKAIKQLFISSTVKFARIATGSLIMTKLTDVVGQAALFSSAIFRTQDEYEEENSIRAGNGRAMVYRKETPSLARKQLGRYSSVISFKRKDWAFMLPRPIEAFLSVSLNMNDPETGAEDVGGIAHQAMYDACLKIAIGEIKKDKAIVALMSGKALEDDSEEEEGEEAEGEEGDEGGTENKAGESDINGMSTGDDQLDDVTMSELEEALQPYLARLEQLLTDPLGDEFGEEYFKAKGLEKFVSRKVRKVIERIKLNFTDYPWESGSVYLLKDVCDYKGQRYCLMGVPGEKLTLDSYTEKYVSVKPPDQDKRWKPEPFGKVIVFCRYTRSVNAIYNALPPELKKLAVKFTGQEKDKWGNMEAFRTTPYSRTKGAQIFIANEQAISEGHNLQMASRLIRVESPWSPGELDQSMCRIFRPDPSGENRRENIYLDWVISNNTLEVAKIGRLISRMVDKAKFDEAENVLYAPLNDTELPPISMSMDTIAATPMLKDIEAYIQNYETLIHLQATEFEELRQTRPSTMFDVPQTPMPKGSSIIEQVPYLPGLKFVPDRHNYGLIKLTRYLQNTDDKDVLAILMDKKKLVGAYVHTEMGNGVIESVRAAKGDGTNEKFAKITRVTVRLVNGDEYSADASMIYLAQNVTKENVRDFSPKNRWATDSDKKAAGKRGKAVEEEDEKISRKKTKQGKRLRKLIADEERKSSKIRELKKLKRRGRVVEDDDEENDEEEEGDETTVAMHPIVYNGYLAVVGTPGEDDEEDMPGIGFKDFGDYAFIELKDLQSFSAVLKFLSEKFYIVSQTMDRLESLRAAFPSGKGRKFAVELAPLSNFKNFYNLSHKLAGVNKDSKKPELKAYPVIINGSLFINIDISTNPIIRKYIGKTINGSRTKFTLGHGLWIKFFSTVADVITWADKIERKGIGIENREDFDAEVTGMKTQLKQMQKLAK